MSLCRVSEMRHAGRFPSGPIVMALQAVGPDLLSVREEGRVPVVARAVVVAQESAQAQVQELALAVARGPVRVEAEERVWVQERAVVLAPAQDLVAVSAGAREQVLAQDRGLALVRGPARARQAAVLVSDQARVLVRASAVARVQVRAGDPALVPVAVLVPWKALAPVLERVLAQVLAEAEGWGLEWAQASGLVGEASAALAWAPGPELVSEWALAQAACTARERE